MADLQHVPGTPETATRPPEGTAPDVAPEAPGARPDIAAQAASGAAAAAAAGAAGGPGQGRGPSSHGLPPGAVGVAALMGLQRSAGNRAAASLVLAGRPGARPPVRAAGSSSPNSGSPGPAVPGSAVEGPRATPDDAGGTHAGPGPATIDALHAAGAPQVPGEATAQRLVVQRQAAQQITPTFTIPIEPDSTKIDFGKASYVRGSVALKGEIKGELVRKGQDSAAVSAGGTSNMGGQTEITLAEQKGFAVFDGLEVDKIKETLSFELSKKKLDVSLGAEASIKTRYPWLKGVVGLKFVLAGVEWEQMAKDPGSAVALGVEVSGGANGEGTVNVNNDFDVKLSVKVVASGEVHPNWPRIAGEVGKRVATEGGKAAVQATTTAAGTSVVAIDLAAVATAAAAILIPLAAAIAMGYGAFQGMKNAKAARDAANYGVQMRAKAEECARGFARTLTGHAPGSDEGSAEADAQIQGTMTSTGASREMVVAAATQEQGGYAAIYAKNLKRIKDKLYAEGCVQYDKQSEPDWGFIEEIGPEWGMRGVFRTTFRMILYHQS